MLTDLLQKVKIFLKENKQDLLLAAVVFLVGVGSFGLGRLSAIWPTKEPITIENQEARITNQGTVSSERQPANQSPDSKFMILNSAPLEGRYVASRNGSSYHLPDCPGAKQIKKENEIWFVTADEARKAGYKPAGNCPGL